MKVAIIGCGAIGSRYLGWVRDMGHDVAGCDGSAERRAWIETEIGVPAFSSVDEAIGWGADRVIVSTPPDQHEVTSLPFFHQSIPVLIEKPIAHTLESAQRIEKMQRAASASAAVVCNMRFHKGIQAIRDNLHRIGKPMSFRGVFGHRLSQMRKQGGDFARKSETGGGVVLDCIHEFDYLRWLFGPILDVHSMVAHVGRDAIDAEDVAEVILRFRRGVVGSLHLDFLMRQKRRGLEVIGEDGNLIWLSTGRAPEVCCVSFGDQNGEQLLLKDENLDPYLEYDGMLCRFLGDGTGLQSVPDAVAALEAAMAAREGR